MSKLVMIDHGEVWTTSLVIAKEFCRPHKNVLQSIDSLIADGTINRLDFKPVEYLDAKGELRRSMHLNERSALVAMPFIGGVKSRAGQKRLVDEFLEMRKELIRLSIQKQDAYWSQKRLEGKGVRLALTDVIQEFVSYAKSQGSQSADKYYMIITKMEYQALELVKQVSDKNFRDSLDAIHHSQLTVVELAAQEAIRQGMTEGLAYKDIYQMAKAACIQLANTLKKLLPSPSTKKPLAKLIAGATS